MRDEPLPLFTAAVEYEARAIVEQQEPTVELRQMTGEHPLSTTTITTISRFGSTLWNFLTWGKVS